MTSTTLPERCSLGLLMRRQRRLLGLTQADLALCSGYSVNMIVQLENGRRRPGPRTIIALARCLKITARKMNYAIKRDKVDD